MPKAYDRHEVLVAPARRHRELYRLVAGLCFIAFVSITLNTMLDGLLAGIVSGYDAQLWWTGTTPGSMLVLLTSFAFLLLGVGLAALILHDRNPLGLIGPLRPAVDQFWRVARYLLGVNVVIYVLTGFSGPDDIALVPNLPLLTWLMLLPLALPALLIQVGAEEFLFRGYLQQSLAARFKSPLIWLVVPSALFGAAHYIPGEAGDNAMLIVIWVTVFGALMADLTARAGTLGPAIAVHFVNNIAALLIVSYPDSMNGLTLYIFPVSMADMDGLRTWLLLDLALIVISWLAARVAIAR